jgi:hypothetical protein
MKHAAFAAVLSLAVGFGAMGVGCTNQTEGERTLMNSNQMKDAGMMIREGEMDVADGSAMVARGETLKNQGDNAGGDALVNQGNARIRRGEGQIQAGRELRDKSK